MTWMRKQPDLRLSVLVKLSRPLRVSPGKLLDLIVTEAKIDSMGEVKF
jgi:hypothetical protein